ncbi:MAG TPA: hypothetical protein VEQ17_05060 [Steroidobacteraceae bacterium]|nr:hypothetical protein [Steroidobacteraceae bacterium]
MANLKTIRTVVDLGSSVLVITRQQQYSQAANDRVPHTVIQLMTPSSIDESGYAPAESCIATIPADKLAEVVAIMTAELSPIAPPPAPTPR